MEFGLSKCGIISSHGAVLSAVCNIGTWCKIAFSISASVRRLIVPENGEFDTTSFALYIICLNRNCD